MWEKLEGNQYIESLYHKELMVTNRQKQFLLGRLQRTIYLPQKYTT